MCHRRTLHAASIAVTLTLLLATSNDGRAEVQAVPDWGGGPQSPYVPHEYDLVFEDNFNFLDLADDERPTANLTGNRREGWSSYFYGWNTRFLEDANDEALKADANYRGGGGPSLGEYGIKLQEITDQGTLKLFGRRTPRELRDQFELPYLGSMISGEHLHAQKYGYWEARFRFARISAGHYWAMWLTPSDYSWPPSIDIIKAVGSNPEDQSQAQYFFFDSWDPSPTTQTHTPIIPPRGYNEWYTIGFLWDANDMRWYLDGEEVRSRPSLKTDKELYFLISLEIGNKRTGLPTPDTQWPTEVEIDYVRIYQKNNLVR